MKMCTIKKGDVIAVRLEKNGLCVYIADSDIDNLYQRLRRLSKLIDDYHPITKK